MKKNKKFWDKVFLAISIFWVICVEIFCLLLLEPNYMQFIVSIGAFFIPFISTTAIIFWLLYIFIFKFPVIKDVKNKLADVYKKGNIEKEHFDKIAEGLDIAIKNQTTIEHIEELEELKQKQEIIEQKQINKTAELQSTLEIVKEIEKVKTEQSNFKEQVKNNINSF